ncbi:MAG: dioxygenase family protein [Bacteroidota bacterium]
MIKFNERKCLKFKLLTFGIIGLLLSCDRPSKVPDAVTLTYASTDTCDSPDADINCCFINMPATLTNTIKIGTDNKLIISGTIFRSDGKTPYPDVIMYTYHTDEKGYYSKKGNETGFQKWHGHLHGWCKTDENGHYEIHSVRPAPYPGNTMPAHIHAALKEPNKDQPYYINDFVFKDDTFVTEKYVSSLINPGGTGIVDIEKSGDGNWTGKRDIVVAK